MTILQGGVPKCGNFWLYQIIQQLLARTGHDTTSFIQRQPIYALAQDWDLNFPDQARIDVLEITDLQYSYRISSIYRMPIEDIRAYLAQTVHVWTHSPVCKRSGELFGLVPKKVYIIRDPRDRALSAAKYYTSRYMLKYFPQEETDPERFLARNFEKLMQEWVWHVFDHLRLSQAHHIHIAFFEGFKLNFQEELGRLLEYLQMDLLPEERADLEQAVSFRRLKKENPQHLKKGESGYWMGQLTDEQLKQADQLAGPLIRYLGYPTDRGEKMTYAPVPAHREYEGLKEEILQSQQGYYRS